MVVYWNCDHEAIGYKPTVGTMLCPWAIHLIFSRWHWVELRVGKRPVITEKMLTWTLSVHLKQIKDIYYCPIEIIKGLIDKGQFQNLTKLKGPQEGTYLYTKEFLSLR